MKEAALFSKLDHIGLVVRDLEGSMKFLESLGLGPFKTHPVSRTETVIQGRVVANESLRNKIAFGRMGEMSLQLIQPAEGKSAQREFLDTRGEGLHHLAFNVDDIDGVVATLRRRNVTPLYECKLEGGGGMAYFELENGGLTFELVQWPGVPPSALYP